jgi:hypothetical protein
MRAVDPAPIHRSPPRPAPPELRPEHPPPRAVILRRVLAPAPPAEVALWLADGQRRAADARLPERVRAAAREQVAVCQALLMRRAATLGRAERNAGASAESRPPPQAADVG